jgi:hypothetical protein
MAEPTPTTTGIIETALYVQDINRSAAFYMDLFGFEEETRGELICVLRVPGSAGWTQALILFARAIADASPGSPPFATQGTIPPPRLAGCMSRSRSIPKKSSRGSTACGPKTSRPTAPSTGNAAAKASTSATRTNT